MASTSDFKNGMTINFDGDIYIINEFMHVKPGKGGAFVRTKLKNAKTGRVIDRTFRAGEKVDEVRLERKKMQYLYEQDEQLWFMDAETYEQYSLSTDLFGNGVKYLKEGDTCDVLFEKDTPITGEVPMFVVLEIVETDPGVKGDTASGGTKPAKLETGAVVQVPLFIQENEKIKVDTRTDEYLERVR